MGVAVGFKKIRRSGSGLGYEREYDSGPIRCVCHVFSPYANYRAQKVTLSCKCSCVGVTIQYCHWLIPEVSPWFRRYVPELTS